MPDSLSDHIDSNLHLLTLSASLTLRYWLNRIKRAGELTAEQAGQDYQSWDLVDQHRAYLLGLLDSTAALYSWVWPLVLELIQVMDPVMRARGYFAEWLPVLQTLANHMTNALEAEDFGDPDAVAKLWRCVALSYIGLGDANRAGVAYTAAARAAGAERGEIGAYLEWLLASEQAAARAWRSSFTHIERVAPNMIRAAREMRDPRTEAMARTSLAFARLYQYRMTEAFEQAQQAYILWAVLGERREQLQALNYMGEALRMAGRTRRARFCLETVRDGIQPFQDRMWEAIIEESLAALLVAEGQSAAAIDALRRVRDLFQTVKDNRRALTATQSLGVALYGAAEYGEAEVVLKQAVAGWQAMKGGELELANTRYTLYKVYRAQGHLQQAYAAQRELAEFVRAKIEAEAIRRRLLGDIGSELSELREELNAPPDDDDPGV